MTDPSRNPSTFPRRVVWSRGPGCRELAQLLAVDRADQVDNNLAQDCIDRRADLAVMRRVGSFDLVPVAAPSGFEPEAVEQVVAAISTGPHSDLAAVIAARIGEGLSVPATAMTAVRPGAPRAGARTRLSEVYQVSGLGGEVLEAESASDLVASLPAGTVVVLGAPGGSWLTRQFFGPGARLVSHAPAGTIVVRDSEPKAFQRMVAPLGIGVHTFAEDALRVMESATIAVTDHGRLIGIARRSSIAAAHPRSEVGEIVEDAPVVNVDDETAALDELVEYFEGPIPVVDRNGLLVGLLPPESVG